MLQVNEFGLAKVIFYKQQLSINVLDVEELIRSLIILTRTTSKIRQMRMFWIHSEIISIFLN